MNKIGNLERMHRLKDCTLAERDSIRANRCPDCGGTGFLQGPSGGLCVNIRCANDACRAEFNLGPVTAERLVREGK